MTRVVLDTDVIVSALLIPGSKPSNILDMVLSGKLTFCYNSAIIVEYEEVLLREKFPFKPQDVDLFLYRLIQDGDVIAAEPLSRPFSDEPDRKFYEVAQAAGAILITGNLKHYPKGSARSPAGFLERER